MANKNNKGLGRGIDAIFKDFESPDLSAVKRLMRKA